MKAHRQGELFSMSTSAEMANGNVVVVVVTLLVAEAPIGNTGVTFSLLILIVLITHY